MGAVEGRWVGGDGVICSLLEGPNLRTDVVSLPVYTVSGPH